MRFAIAVALVGSLAGSAVADPFEHRNPAPDAPPGAHPRESSAPYLLDDPGKPRRTEAKVFAATGAALMLGSLVLSIHEKDVWNQAVASQPKDVGAANGARDIARYVGTPLFLAGAAAVGTAAYLYLTAPKDLVRRPIVAPAIGGDQVGVAVVGAF